MELAQIQAEAKYQKKNYKTVKGFIKSLDVEEQEMEVGGKTFQLNNSMLQKALSRLNIASIVNPTRNKFEKPENTLPEEFMRCPKCKQSRTRNRDSIVEDTVKLGIRHQSAKAVTVYDKTNNEVKGVVTDRYKFVNNLDVLNSAIEVYGNNIDTRLSYINSEKISVFFQSDEVMRTPLAHEKILYGYNVINSQTGFTALTLKKSLVFLRCTNGLVLDEIEHKKSLAHVSEGLLEIFKDSLDYFLKDRTVLDIIDDWASKPAIMDREFLLSAKGYKKIHKLLGKYDVKEDLRKDIYDTLINKQEEENKINAYWIGNAVNYYASNNLNDVIEANNLLSAAYNVMNMY